MKFTRDLLKAALAIPILGVTLLLLAVLWPIQVAEWLYEENGKVVEALAAVTLEITWIGALVYGGWRLFSG